MVITVGVWSKACPLIPSLVLLGFCYLANLLGAACMGWIITSTGLMDNSVGKLLVDACAVKMTLPFSQALFRGIMCNIMVCLGSWMIGKIKSDAAKMIALVWVVAGFVTPGYEHSIANSGLFTMAMLSSIPNAGITIAGILSNMVPVTIGNLIGGALVGTVYWVSGSSPYKC